MFEPVALAWHAVEYYWKGRLLPYIYDWTTERLNRLSVEAEEWTQARFGNNIGLWQECISGVRFTIALAKPAMREYDVVPLLLSRLDAPGVKARVQRQWRGCPPVSTTGALDESLSSQAPWLRTSRR